MVEQHKDSTMGRGGEARGARARRSRGPAPRACRRRARSLHAYMQTWGLSPEGARNFFTFFSSTFFNSRQTRHCRIAISCMLACLHASMQPAQPRGAQPRGGGEEFFLFFSATFFNNRKTQHCTIAICYLHTQHLLTTFITTETLHNFLRN